MKRRLSSSRSRWRLGGTSCGFGGGGGKLNENSATAGGAQPVTNVDDGDDDDDDDEGGDRSHCDDSRLAKQSAALDGGRPNDELVEEEGEMGVRGNCWCCWRFIGGRGCPCPWLCPCP